MFASQFLSWADWAAITECYGRGLNNKNLFLTVLETEVQDQDAAD